MKKGFLLLVVLTVVFSASAQSDSPAISPWYLDISLGIVQSKLSGSEVDFMQSIVTSHRDGELKMKSRTGIGLDFLARRRLGNHFHLKSGLQYVQRGASLENTGYVQKPYPSAEYLGVPFIIGVTTGSYGNEKAFGLYLNGGMAYLLNVADNSTWVTKTHSVLDIVIETGVEIALSRTVSLGLNYKLMKDLNKAHTFSRQYSDGTGNLNLRREYDYYYTTQTFSASLRVNVGKNG